MIGPVPRCDDCGRRVWPWQGAVAVNLGLGDRPKPKGRGAVYIAHANCAYDEEA